MAEASVPSDQTTKERSADELLKENLELQSKLKAFKNLEEELMAQKVFENAKKKLMVWLTVGGMGTLVLGWVGFKEIEDYTQKLVKSKVESKLSEDDGES